MKTCTKCSEAKAATTEFFRPRGKQGGLEAMCRVCRAAQARTAYAQNPELYGASHKRWRQAHRGRLRKVLSKWPKAHPEEMKVMRRATQAVLRAVRKGVLTKPDRCEACGTIGPVDGAHFDYAQPLNVRWLCQSCHRRWDRADPKHKTIEPAAVTA